MATLMPHMLTIPIKSKVPVSSLPTMVSPPSPLRGVLVQIISVMPSNSPKIITVALPTVSKSQALPQALQTVALPAALPIILKLVIPFLKVYVLTTSVLGLNIPPISITAVVAIATMPTKITTNKLPMNLPPLPLILKPSGATTPSHATLVVVAIKAKTLDIVLPIPIPIL